MNRICDIAPKLSTPPRRNDDHKVVGLCLLDKETKYCNVRCLRVSLGEDHSVTEVIGCLWSDQRSDGLRIRSEVSDEDAVVCQGGG